jgi:hypothetical protein
MDRKHIPKALEDAIREEDGHRYIARAHPEDPSSWVIFDDRVYMHCEGVYGYALLTLHTIDSNGEVNASVLCTDGTGGEYHEWVILDDWPSKMHKRAGQDTPELV